MIDLEASFCCHTFRRILYTANSVQMCLSSCFSTPPPRCPGGWPTCSKGPAPNDPMGTNKEALDGVQWALAPACLFSVAR